ncbi:hypothetical protein EAI72_00120 [Escherichia coli]|nr:hypothetical protein EAI72_00120 [Escherichia coli]
MVIVNEHDNHDRQRLDSSLVYIGAHNVLNMLNDCTKCWHLAFCNELPDVVFGAHNVLNMLNDCTKCWHLAFCNELPDVVTCFLA